MKEEVVENTREKVSAVVITLNEESNLPKCLDSIQWMDEIVVVDAGSQDDTCNLAKRYTEKVFQKNFVDYASQKNYGVFRASNDWIFSIDADEVMPLQLKAEVENILSQETKEQMFAVPRQNIFFGHHLKYVLGRDEPVRLFRRSIAHFEGPVHEKVVGGTVGRLSAPLLHYSCNSYREWVQKHRRYVRIDARRQFKQGRCFSWIRLCLSPWRTFFYRYALLEGWKDGWAGFTVALEMSFSMFLFQIELRRLARLTKVPCK
ncbi:MAG: glycosyltransferase family 2 protein [Deltaproteobacteria bacterium]|nr:glycosyltransferase family 2 protein [Deltaproteobacteria bacterium]MBW1978062.1 glycosyltransferase family 2 protein [Deltaproteobacteria bacterium]MBW2044881.1 glycosyltransferase family 2 protein [Deltaproteobacteria bacterium]MBW2301250.1 glycosyltransferase family 2 protein [Deltaproteobacteria bacterium]